MSWLYSAKHSSFALKPEIRETTPAFSANAQLQHPTPAGNEVPDDGDDGDDKKQMNQSAAHREYEKAECPKDYQNYRNCEKHGMLLCTV